MFVPHILAVTWSQVAQGALCSTASTLYASLCSQWSAQDCYTHSLQRTFGYRLTISANRLCSADELTGFAQDMSSHSRDTAAHRRGISLHCWHSIFVNSKIVPADANMACEHHSLDQHCVLTAASRQNCPNKSQTFQPISAAISAISRTATWWKPFCFCASASLFDLANRKQGITNQDVWRHLPSMLLRSFSSARICVWESSTSAVRRMGVASRGLLACWLHRSVSAWATSGNSWLPSPSAWQALTD